MKVRYKKLSLEKKRKEKLFNQITLLNQKKKKENEKLTNLL